jgi:thiol-disulfide isomerase/thioredoxin
VTPRLLLTFGLISLTIAPALAQDKPPRRSPANPLVREALEAAKQELPKAIAILERALETSPDDRDALYLLGAMTVVQADKCEGQPERIAMFRKSADAFTRLEKAYKDLTSYERVFRNRSRIGEARVLANEGRAEQALVVIKQAFAAGFDDFYSLNDKKDMEAVRQLPGFKTVVEQTFLPGILKEMASLEPFPFQFKLKDLDGRPFSSSGLKGKVTIVDVWGTWCPPCRAEIPHLIELYDQYKGRGLEIIGINCREQGSADAIKQKVKDFAREFKIPYTCVLNDETTEDKIPGFKGYPTTLFLDRTGKVRMMLVGYSPKVKLELIVTTLLSEATMANDRVDESK